MSQKLLTTTLIAATCATALTACSPPDKDPGDQGPGANIVSSDNRDASDELDKDSSDKDIAAYIKDNQNLPDKYLEQLIPEVQAQAQLEPVELSVDDIRDLGDKTCKSSYALDLFKYQYLGDKDAMGRLVDTDTADREAADGKFLESLDSYGSPEELGIPALFASMAQCSKFFSDDNIDTYGRVAHKAFHLDEMRAEGQKKFEEQYGSLESKDGK